MQQGFRLTNESRQGANRAVKAQTGVGKVQTGVGKAQTGVGKAQTGMVELQSSPGRIV